MATVTVTGVVKDETGRKDSRDWKAFSPVYREGSDGEVVTMRKQQVRVVAGMFSAKLDPGVCVLENPDGQRYTVTIPDEDADLWGIIATAVAFPPNTEAEALASAVNAYLDDNPPAADWNGLINMPAVIAEGATQAAARAAIGAGEQPLVDTAANLAASNPIPAVARRVRETDTGREKTGDGTTHYNDLPYDVDRSDVSMRAPQRVQLTDNCIGRCQNMTVTSVGTYRFAHRVGVAGTDIQLGFGNFYTGLIPNLKDFDPATSVTFSAAFEDAAGNVYAATFNGQRSVVLPGGGSVLSDPLPINVAVSDVVWVRVYISAGTAYSNRGTGLSSVGGFTAATDLTASGAGAVGATFAIGGFDAMCIVGTPTSTDKPRSVAVQGDSLAVGIGDGPYAGNEFGYLPQVAVNPYYCGGGYLQRALSGHAGSIIEAQTGDSVNNFLTGVAHFRRDALTRFTKYAVVEYGRNDVSAGRTAVQVQTDLLKQATRNIARGIIGNVIVTLTPISTSTDNWATIENQTAHATEAIRVAHNAWVRAGCPIVSGAPVAVGTSGALLAGQPGHPIKGYIEVADSVESARDSGKWKAANRAVTDASISSSGTTLTSATANFTSADIGRDVNVAGAGAAGGVLTAVITTINSSTSVTLTTPASTTVSGAICAIGVYTGDGTHSSVGGHAAMATAIQAPLLALLS